MGATYRCPGYEYEDTARTAHADGCCARFVLMSEERRAEVGRRQPSTEPRPEPSRPPAPETITVPELIKIVAGMQRRATEQPDEEPPYVTVWIEIGPDDDFDHVMALIDMGRPYNLVPGWRQVHTPEKG
jgi:hypothetical protein